MSASTVLQWDTCEGRDGYDHPLAMPDYLAQHCVDVTLNRGSLPAKRHGSSAVTLAGDTFSGYAAIYRYLPGQDPSAQQLFIVSKDATVKILQVASGNTATALTLTDAVTSAIGFSFAVLNTRLYIAYRSGLNRLQYFDASMTTNIHRAGLLSNSTFTVGNTGGGGYPATPRWYRIAIRRVDGAGAVVAQSNLGTAVAFTPSGGGTAARLTLTGFPSDGGITHWVVFGAAQSIDGPYYELAQVILATTTYDDSVLPSAYNLNVAAPVEGSCYPFPGVKYLLSDGTRLFGFGVWEPSTNSGAGYATAVSGRVYFTPALGSSNLGDDQRHQMTLTQNDWIDMSVNAGGVDRGLGGPINGVIYAFQSQGIFAIIPTGQATAPFRRVVIDRAHGAVSHESIVLAEDELGAPALYFLDPLDGPRRLGLGQQMQWLGRDMVDLWSTVNLSATIQVAHGVYDRANKRIIWWVATGVSNTPNQCFVFQVTLGRLTQDNEVRGGWALWTGAFAAAQCSTMFGATLASTRPLVEIPYAALTALWRQDTSLDDRGTAYQGYVQSRAFDQGITRMKRITEAYLQAVPASVTIQQTVEKDFALETSTDSVSLAAVGSESYVRRRFEATDVANAVVLQIRLGDAAAVAGALWALNRWEGIGEVQSGAKA